MSILRVDNITDLGDAPVVTAGALQIASSELPAGSVLQVVQSTYATETSTTSTSYVSTGLTGTITPTSATSKILVMVDGTVQPATTTAINFTVFRGTTSGTDLGGGVALQRIYNGPTVIATGFNVLDSPATTSSQLYTMAFKVTSGSYAVAQQANVQARMIMMEVAG